MSKLTNAPRSLPPVVAILGPDGSGKSTVIEGVSSRLAARGLEMETLHWRPNLVKPANRTGGPVTDPHGAVPRSYAQSVPKLGLLLLDWWKGYATIFKRARAEGRLVLCDRHYLDLLVDPVRYRFKGPMWLAAAAFRAIPRPTLLILLDVPPEEIQRRKQEVPPEETARQVAAYRRVVGKQACGVIVDAARTPDEVADEVTEKILASYQPPIK